MHYYIMITNFNLQISTRNYIACCTRCEANISIYIISCSLFLPFLHNQDEWQLSPIAAMQNLQNENYLTIAKYEENQLNEDSINVMPYYVYILRCPFVCYCITSITSYVSKPKDASLYEYFYSADYIYIYIQTEYSQLLFKCDSRNNMMVS